MIFHIQRFSVNDGPGIRTTVFFKGCPLRCQWCHNPESISAEKQLIVREDRCRVCGDCKAVCKNSAIEHRDGRYTVNRDACRVCGDCVSACVAGAREIVGREVSTDELMREIEKDRAFFDQSGGGVTFSGGEPLYQHQFLLALLEECKRRTIHTTVDTCGFTSPEILDCVSPFVDLFLYDLKTLDTRKHKEFTRVSNHTILENLRRLVAAGRSVIVRIPLIPGVNDSPADITQTGEFVRRLQKINDIHVLPFHTTGQDKYRRLGLKYDFGGHAELPLLTVQTAVRHLGEYVRHVSIGG